MKLLLDTIYLLPAIGISVKDLNEKAVLNLADKGHELFISEVSLFELSAKGAKYVVEGRLSPERVCRGINAIVYDERIKITRMHETSILLTAFKLRKIIDDLINCIILSSAINHAEVLVTEDEDLHKLSKEISSLKPEFKIRRLKEIL